jgi:hypothetical protein
MEHELSSILEAMGLIVLPQKHCLDCVSKTAQEVVVADHSTHVVNSMAEYL